MWFVLAAEHSVNKPLDVQLGAATDFFNGPLIAGLGEF
jgi:hypothetical protein